MTVSVYYNEINAYCAQWLRNFFAAQAGAGCASDLALCESAA